MSDWIFVCRVILTSLLGIIVYCAGLAVYNLYFHPLSKYPGPRWAAVTRLWTIHLEIIKGESLVTTLFKLHSIHGDIVRIGPNELHFSKPSVYNEIYNSRNRWTKDQNLYQAFSEDVSSFSMLEYHEAKKRKDILLPLFSRKAIINMQDAVLKMLDLLCDAIVYESKQGRPINLLEALHCFAMDTITMFCFARSMDCLKAPRFHAPITSSMHSGQRYFPYFKHFPFIRAILRWFGPVIACLQPKVEGLVAFRKMIMGQIRDVLQHPEKLMDAPHPIIYHELLREENGRKRPSEMSLRDEAVLLVAAGTDTVSNTSTVGFVNIIGNKDIYAKLRAELWDAWPTLEERPRYEQLESLPYLGSKSRYTAVIKESLRLSHGVWSPMTRVVPPEGATLSGEYIPGGTIVSISNLFVHLDATVFSDPYSFKPERWLEPGAEALETYLVAFSKGPRSCLGVNLGWCELYLVFSNLFRRFDFQLDGFGPADMQWRECYIPSYVGPPLTIRAKPIYS